MMTSRETKREGAVLYPAEMRVRLRHEPSGFVYQLAESDDRSHFVVTHIDTLTGETKPAGIIRRNGARLVPEKTGNASKDDALNLVARAWTRLPFLKASSAS